MNWDDDGCYLYGGKLHSPIEAEIINDLPYIDREQFEDVRLALAASHRLGRVPATGYKENQHSTGEPNYNYHQISTVQTQAWDHKKIHTARSTSPYRSKWHGGESAWKGFNNGGSDTTYSWTYRSFGGHPSW